MTLNNFLVKDLKKMLKDNNVKCGKLNKTQLISLIIDRGIDTSKYTTSKKSVVKRKKKLDDYVRRVQLRKRHKVSVMPEKVVKRTEIKPVINEEENRKREEMINKVLEEKEECKVQKLKVKRVPKELNEELLDLNNEHISEEILYFAERLIHDTSLN